MENGLQTMRSGSQNTGIRSEQVQQHLRHSTTRKNVLQRKKGVAAATMADVGTQAHATDQQARGGLFGCAAVGERGGRLKNHTVQLSLGEADSFILFLYTYTD